VTGWPRGAIVVADILILGYLIVHAVVTVWILVLSRRRVLEFTPRDTAWTRTALLQSPLAPTVPIVIPAYDEEAGILDATRAALSLEYPNLEVVVVDDGGRRDRPHLRRLHDHRRAPPSVPERLG
jgi:cellulose synthase/poly-beta-1,6-N-acetylglucosamine synthase-like glycosyltransferase